MWLDSKAVNCPQKWGNFSLIRRAAIRSAFPKDPTDYSIDVRSIKPAADTADGKDVRAFEIALSRLRENPDMSRFVIHESGPLCANIGERLLSH